MQDLNLVPNLKNMTNLINQIEEEHDNRFQMINGMNGLIKAMARSETCRDVETQVGDGELFWNVQPDHGEPV